MTSNPPRHDISEVEFIAALRQRWPRHLAAQATPDEWNEWKQFAREHPSRGLRRFNRISSAFAQVEKMIQRGVEPKSALQRAMEAVGVSFPTYSAADQKAWLRRLEQSYRDRPQHHHALLDAGQAYGVEHALYALVCRLPEIAAAIFITSDTDMRKRIIRAVF